ncbi:LysR family transcriptional regulator [Actinoplanes sp. DH11]|uniref:LysR family transcriptional regulator n=1 Tax=Actinoplanes sp. DH11 TaxID=2857011 RepID=UPI001E4F6D68|nr:LysR family transcriptional regulator [Actinoplanes sp. DH11]
MDLIEACRVFVHVGEKGSFTLGAAAAGVPQPVASRRVAALERRFGEQLFDRAARRAVLTAFGRDMLPPAKRLVQLADTLDHDVEQAKLRPLALSVPDVCPVRRLALLDAAARSKGTVLDFRPAGPAARFAAFSTGEVRAALVAVPPGEATWVVPLGLGTVRNEGTEPTRIETLRPGRARSAWRRIWIQPEDDVAHVRDRLTQLGHRAALMPAQIAVAPTLTAAVSDVVRTGNLLLCSAAQAEELELYWRPLTGDPVGRGYAVSAAIIGDGDRFRGPLHHQVGLCLGAEQDGAPR